MSPIRVHLRSKILKEVRLILGLIAIPMAIIIYFVFFKPIPLQSDEPILCHKTETKQILQTN